jgi:CRP-like cAMP-binding protein
MEQENFSKSWGQSGFPHQVLKILADYATQRRYTPDQHIIYEGEECTAVYFILEGEVKVYLISPQGRQQVLVQLGPGQAFNTVPVFLSNGVNNANVVAVTPVTLLILGKHDIDDVIRLCPDLALVLLTDFAKRLTHLSQLAGDLALQSVRGRLASFLLNQAQKTPTAHWTHENIATHIGTVREVVSRTMREFIKQGWIRKDRHRLIIIDSHALEVLTQE